MKKSTKIIAGITAAVLTLGIAGCSKNTVYPNFINPEITTNPPATAEKYVVNVTSEGGFGLNGVLVNAVSNGQVVKRGISVDGKIEFAMGLGEYELRVDESSLPAGYKLPTTTYKTSATSREPVNIQLPSALIPAANSSQCSYTLGTMMRDFTFTATDGTYTLSELLKTKKAVVLNFWYSGCGPCRSEFPAIQKAYSSRNDIEILALCSTHQGDTQQIVSKFKEDNGLHFPMGIDTLGLTTSFNVGAFPTTFIIDRYGMIAYRSSGSDASASSWTSLFNKFTADDYSQKDVVGGGGDDNPDKPIVPIEKPNVEMPASAVLEKAANAEGFKATYRGDEDEYSWPWLAGSDEDGAYIYSSNTGKGNSYSIVYADIDMKKDEVLSFEYNVDSEAGCDFLHVFIDGDLISGEGYSATNGWKSLDAYVADRDKTVELSFAYIKDEADIDTYEGKDVAKVRNIHLSDKSVIQKPIDVLRTCTNGETDNFRYEYYQDVVKGEDGYYHNKDTGAIIYISLNQLTPWTDLHTTSTTTTGNTTYYSTLYQLTYYNYAVSTGNNFNVTIGDLNITKTLQTFYEIQSYMPGPYYLVPVNEQLKEWAQKFAVEYGEKKLGQKAYADSWLEFCYYYDHYGSDDNLHEDDKCWATEDHTRGLSVNNAFKAYEKNDPEIVTAEKYNPETKRMKAEITYPMQGVRNGTYYEFTPTQTGIYQIRSYTSGCSSEGTAPGLSVYNKNGTITDVAEEPLDFDQWLPTSQQGVRYEGFNHYVSLKAGETVYLMLEDAPSTTGHYEFDIEYKGTSLSKLMVCSTGGGSWTGNNGNNYMGIRYALGDDGYYYAANRNGTPDYDSPIFIDMVYSSYFACDIPAVIDKTLEFIIDGRYFENGYNGRFIKGGDRYQKQLATALTKSKEEGVDIEIGGETVNVKGFVRADKDLVEIINKFIDCYVDGGRGEGNGWLAFAVYVKNM